MTFAIGMLCGMAVLFLGAFIGEEITHRKIKKEIDSDEFVALLNRELETALKTDEFCDENSEN